MVEWFETRLLESRSAVQFLVMVEFYQKLRCRAGFLKLCPPRRAIHTCGHIYQLRAYILYICPHMRAIYIYMPAYEGYIRIDIARICGYIRFRYKGKLNRKWTTLYIGVLSGIFIYIYIYRWYQPKYPPGAPFWQISGGEGYLA